MKLTKSQLDLLRNILMEHCETNDTSETIAARVDKLWNDINTINEGMKK